MRATERAHARSGDDGSALAGHLRAGGRLDASEVADLVKIRAADPAKRTRTLEVAGFARLARLTGKARHRAEEIQALTTKALAGQHTYRTIVVPTSSIADMAVVSRRLDSTRSEVLFRRAPTPDLRYMLCRVGRV